MEQAQIERKGKSKKEEASFFDIFVSFTKMGAVLIGGGYALLPLLEREIVNRRKWAKSEEMLDLYALAQLLPGVIAINTAMLVGNRLRGWKGTIVSSFGLILVPFILIVSYAAAYGYLKDISLFSRALAGVQAAIAGMILALGYEMVRKTRKYALAFLASIVVLLFNVSFIWIILAVVLFAFALHLWRFWRK
ncbi:MAG: chromate transporter [Kiritimatiellae bacterium]|nr:chromate transporter [Kiritimatiellia bacterium]